MPSFKEHNNPFYVQSPEDLSAEDAHSLFVDVFSDFPRILNPGHTFLHGPRGSGKSMMFRYLLSDCQIIAADNCSLAELDHFAIWIKLKNTDLKIMDLTRLENKHASSVINEHLMVMYIAEKVFDTVIDHALPHAKFGLSEIKDFMKDVFFERLALCGWNKDNQSETDNNAGAYFETMKLCCQNISAQVQSYIKKLAFVEQLPVYQGALCGYLDFLYPILCGLNKLSAMPKGPIFLLLDDADNLNLTQTKILNSWVNTRTHDNVSLKISTQLRYKTYKTINDQTIQSPHDFSETDISTVYTTSNKDLYPQRIEQIVKQRFDVFKIKTNPKDFFPPDKKQLAEIENIYEQYKNSNNPRSNRSIDDAYRYAIPDYIKSLGGPSKSRNSYSYSGFKQLIDISSGIIRFFLEPASTMYSKMMAANPNTSINEINPGTQNNVIRDYADKFMFLERERLQKEEGSSRNKLELIDKLFNLIEVLGGTFSQILMSNRSERRVISIAFYKRPSQNLQEVLDLGMEYGYLHPSTIGNKEGTGRVRQYILSRRLAPYYNLDPTGFSGYLFVSEDQIWEAIEHPSRILRRIRAEGADSVFIEEEEPTLFD